MATIYFCVSTFTARLQLVPLYISLIIAHKNDSSKYLCCRNHVWSSLEWTRTSSEVIGFHMCSVAKVLLWELPYNKVTTRTSKLLPPTQLHGITHPIPNQASCDQHNRSLVILLASVCKQKICTIGFYTHIFNIKFTKDLLKLRLPISVCNNTTINSHYSQ